MTRLYTVDTKALNHILMNNYIYQKPASAKYNLSTVVGGGVLVAEADVHRQQVGTSLLFSCSGEIYAILGVAKDYGMLEALPSSPHFLASF